MIQPFAYSAPAGATTARVSSDLEGELRLTVKQRYLLSKLVREVAAAHFGALHEYKSITLEVTARGTATLTLVYGLKRDGGVTARYRQTRVIEVTARGAVRLLNRARVDRHLGKIPAAHGRGIHLAIHDLTH